MRRSPLNGLLWVFLLFMVQPLSGQQRTIASSSVPANLCEVTARAATIFVGRVISIKPMPPASSDQVGCVQITLQVEQGIRGARAGEHFQLPRVGGALVRGRPLPRRSTHDAVSIHSQHAWAHESGRRPRRTLSNRHERPGAPHSGPTAIDSNLATPKHRSSSCAGAGSCARNPRHQRGISHGQNLSFPPASSAARGASPSSRASFRTEERRMRLE
jgi:hypothetical protein